MSPKDQPEGRIDQEDQIRGLDQLEEDVRFRECGRCAHRIKRKECKNCYDFSKFKYDPRSDIGEGIFAFSIIGLIVAFIAVVLFYTIY